METQSAEQSALLSVDEPIPLRFFGMGIYLAWLLTMHYTTSSFSTPRLALAALIMSNVATLIGLIFVAVFARRIAPISTKRGCRIVAALCSALGTATAIASPNTGAAFMLVFVIANFSVGVGAALLILLWSELYAGLSRRDVCVFASGSYIVAAAICLIASMNSGLWLDIAVSLLPVISVVMLMLSVDMLSGHEESVAESVDSNWTFPWRPAILLAVYAFASTVSRSMNFAVVNFSMVGMIALATVILIVGLFFFDRFDVRMLYKITPPLIVAGILAIAFFDGADILGAVAINAGFSGFTALTLIVLCNMSYSYGVTAIWLFGITRAFRVAATVLGAIAYPAMRSHGIGNEFIGACIIVLVVTCAMLFLSSDDFTTTWGITPKATRKEDYVQGFFSTLQGKCAIIARENGLTPREEEVLGLLAQDKKISDVEEMLVVSNGTAKSHIRHVYAKLNVHSRKEIFELVERTGSDGMS